MNMNLASIEDEVFSKQESKVPHSLENQICDDFLLINSAECYSVNMSSAESAITMLNMFYFSEESEFFSSESNDIGENLKETLSKIWNFILNIMKKIVEAISNFFAWFTESIKKILTHGNNTVEGTSDQLDAAAKEVEVKLSAKIESMDNEEVKKKWYDPTRLADVYKHITTRRKEKEPFLTRFGDIISTSKKVLVGGVSVATAVITAKALLSDLQSWSDKSKTTIGSLGGLTKDDLKRRSLTDRIFKKKLDIDTIIAEDRTFKVTFGKVLKSIPGIISSLTSTKVIERESVTLAKTINTIISLFQKDEILELGVARKCIGTLTLSQQIKSIATNFIAKKFSGEIDKKMGSNKKDGKSSNIDDYGVVV